jgi:hypothetical protein
MKHYRANWGAWLVVMSSLLAALFLGTAVVALKAGGALSWVGGLLAALVAGCALLAIRGYTVTPDAILIHRWFWATRLPLASLEAAWFDPRAMRWSFRFGNPGFFSLTGFYRNKFFGAYRAFATDGRLTVVLQFSDRTVVVSPVAPEDFVDEVVNTSHAACGRPAAASVYHSRKTSNAFGQTRQDGRVPHLRA